MHLPKHDKTSHDPFIASLREDDAKKYLSTRWGSAQRFINTRRFDLCLELIKKYVKESKKTALFGDFACGTANIGIQLAEEGYNVDLIENEKKFFEYIKLKTEAQNINFITADITEYLKLNSYTAIFLGEAIEHVANPDMLLKNIYKNLKHGGYLILTTPNGDYIDCYEPNWNTVKEEQERNIKLSNTLLNHVCEFTPSELKELIKMAGFCIFEHRIIQSKIVCKSNILRRLFPKPLLWMIDDIFSKHRTNLGKYFGMNQIVVAQKTHTKY